MGRPLDGRRALVTGAGTGIGREIALEMARQGAAVALHRAHSREGAGTACAEIRAAGGKAEVFAADFADLEAVRAVARDATAFLGGLDVLVNNAGITLARPFQATTPEQFDVVYAVNVRAPYFLTQALVPALEEDGGGAIVAISSVHGVRGCPGHSVYAGTKGAIIAQARELAIELAPRGIRVNAVAPGAVPVENHERIGAVAEPEAVGRLIPAGFAGRPLDIARLVCFLASDAARYIVGQTLVADGGTSAWLAFGETWREQGTAPFGQGYVPGV